MGRAASLNERLLIRLIEAGEWEIDDQGRIWRMCTRFGLRGGGSHLVPVTRRRVETQLPRGYLMVRAMMHGERICGLAHRLVWQHFNGDIPHGYEINHRNGLKDDNRPINLLCGPASENIAHAHRSGLLDQSGQQNPAAKLTDNQVAQIRNAYAQGGYTMAALADRFAVSFQTVSKIVRGQRRRKQGGPTTQLDQRYCSSERDPATGRFIGKKRAGAMLDGREHREFPA